MGVNEILALIQQGGPTALLVTMVVLLMRGTLITQGQYREMMAEKQSQIDAALQREQEWQNLALTGTSMAERALHVAGIAPQRRSTP